MAKQSFADKIAEKAFKGATVQRSWQVHLQAFGPILEPAFVGKYQALTHLCSALNQISNRKVKEGLDKLKQVEKYCETDADYAALMFCTGLAWEMGGDTQRMIDCYRKAGEYGHSFYLLYLKLAKAAHSAEQYELAEENYHKAIALLNTDAAKADFRNQIVLASAYTNLASCLTMLLRFKEAEAMLEKSKEVQPVQSGRGATEAILHAAMGQPEKIPTCLAELEQHLPELVPAVKQTVEEILSGTHPHFGDKAE